MIQQEKATVLGRMFMLLRFILNFQAESHNEIYPDV
jgi:hypothetical protein